MYVNASKIAGAILSNDYAIIFLGLAYDMYTHITIIINDNDDNSNNNSNTNNNNN